MILHDVRRVAAEDCFEALSRLKDEGYNVLVDLTAVDYSAYPGTPREDRFEVVYRLMSLDDTGLEGKGRVELRCGVGEGPELLSVKSLWPIADWLEREVWDMFGVRFKDRPDLKRLLLYESFKGHPLRKDYPINKRQPQIGPASGEPVNNPSFNELKPTIKFE